MSSDTSDSSPGIVQRVLLLLFVGGILETLGMLLYLQWASPAALERLMADGIQVGELISFLLASPDRLLVAGGLAILALFFAWNAESGGPVHHNVGGGEF